MDNSRLAYRCWLLVGGVIVSIIGCAPANPRGRVAVSGNVTLDGQPIDRGTIEFAPIGGSVGSGAKITNGAFTIEEAKGLPSGKYRVRIFAPKLPAATQSAKSDSLPGPEGNFLGIEQVDVRYNTKTTLSIEVPTSSEPQIYNFAVRRK